MSGSKELIAILSEEIMSYAFKNTSISKQLLRVALALRRDFRKWRRMCKDSQRFFQDFAVTASLDTLSANFAQTIAEDIGDWESGAEAHLQEIYALLEECNKAFVLFTLLRLIAIRPSCCCNLLTQRC